MSIPKGGYYYIGQFVKTINPLPIPADAKDRLTEIVDLLRKGAATKRFYLRLVVSNFPPSEFNVNYYFFDADFTEIKIYFSHYLLAIDWQNHTYILKEDE